MLSELKENRRKRLRQLIESIPAGGKQARVAAQIGIAPDIVSRYLGGTKGIGEVMRARIENAFGLPRGWMDVPVELDEKRDKTHETPLELLPSANVAREPEALEYASSSESIFFSDELRTRFVRLTTEGRAHARARLLIGIEEAEEMYPIRANTG